MKVLSESGLAARRTQVQEAIDACPAAAPILRKLLEDIERERAARAELKRLVRELESSKASGKSLFEQAFGK